VAEPRPSASEFLFVTCQVGAERALKSEIACKWPALHFAFSRGGFVTFKLTDGLKLSDDLDLDCAFARAHGFSLEKVSAAELHERAEQVARIAASRPFDVVHVWQRDAARPGWRGFEPHITVAAQEAEAAILQAFDKLGSIESPRAGVAEAGELVLDCVLVEPDLWWTGHHRAGQNESCFAGGLRPIAPPPDAVSRAWAKMEEAFQWSRFPVRPGQRLVELGCAPGGASQAALARGLLVMGVDPAAVDPVVAAHSNFTHVQKRAADMRRRDFRGFKWLVADMNIAPASTLEAVEAIVTHPSVEVQGLLLTLKLLDWQQAEQLPEFQGRIRSWGYPQVRARQLAHNRQEVCVAALRPAKKSHHRDPKLR
jgi:23S rRNA (cytidine2498-2'-O)-methyltransferase